MSFCIGLLRKRFLFYNVNVVKMTPSVSQNLQLYYLYSTTNKNLENSHKSLKESKKINIPEQSVLEQILLKHEKEPQTTAEKVKRKVENTFFYTVAAASIVAVSVLAYLLINSFWANDSPQRIYSKALKLILQDDRCIELLGDKISAYGEDTGRGRRRHIANSRYIKEGIERVRIMFHLKGNLKRGRAYAEVEKINGNWDYRFLYVESDGIVPDTVVIIDNR